MTAAERMRRYRERRRAGATPDDAHLSPQEKRDQHRSAFMLRADYGTDLAVYDEASAAINDDVIASAEYAMTAWKKLCQRLRAKRPTKRTGR